MWTSQQLPWTPPPMESLEYRAYRDKIKDFYHVAPLTRSVGRDAMLMVQNTYHAAPLARSGFLTLMQLVRDTYHAVPIPTSRGALRASVLLQYKYNPPVTPMVPRVIQAIRLQGSTVGIGSIPIHP